MISICVPIYNIDVTNLISSLSKQIRIDNLPCEIILIDDASSGEFKQLNEIICAKETYIELPKNIGRSKIRNLFLNYAKLENLLFLDCDSKIIETNYLKKYIQFITESPNYNIAFGGSVYDKKPPKRIKMLRWKYGIKKESQTLATRKQTPNKSFMTNNFLINKKVFEKVKFDERIREYGHEDTLFGYMLCQNNYNITHINNTVLNNNIEDNTEYLQKTEKSINNLISILEYVNNDKELIKSVTLLDFYKKMKSRKLINIIYLLFLILKPILKYSFTVGYVNIYLFDFYKLGILIKQNKKK